MFLVLNGTKVSETNVVSSFQIHGSYLINVGFFISFQHFYARLFRLDYPIFNSSVVLKAEVFPQAFSLFDSSLFRNDSQFDASSWSACFSPGSRPHGPDIFASLSKRHLWTRSWRKQVQEKIGIGEATSKVSFAWASR